MNPKLRMKAGLVLIRPEKDPEQIGAIHIPNQARDRDMPQFGTVLAIGGRLLLKSGKTVEPEFKVNDRVLFRKFTGTFIEIEGERLIYTKQHEVLCVLE
jgi:chaperonin GroES